MKKLREILLLVTAIGALPWPACGQPRGASIIEAAPAGQPYDYVIHAENTYDYRYNPEVRDDRVALARQIVKPFCSKSRIVGEAKRDTEIFGLITGRPDYVVYVKCLPSKATSRRQRLHKSYNTWAREHFVREHQVIPSCGNASARGCGAC